MSRRRLNLLTLSVEIRKRIVEHLVLDNAHVRLKRRELSLDEIKQGCDMAPGSRPAVYRYSLSPPFAKVLSTCRQLYNEVLDVVKSCDRFLTVDHLWLYTTLPLFVRSNILYEKHVKTLVFRTTERTMGEADDLRKNEVMNGYLARIRREQLLEKLALKVTSHQAHVEGEREVDPRRVLLFVVHEVTVG